MYFSQPAGLSTVCLSVSFYDRITELKVPPWLNTSTYERLCIRPETGSETSEMHLISNATFFGCDATCWVKFILYVSWVSACANRASFAALSLIQACYEM